MKNISINILCFALPFIVGCSTVNANTPTKTWGGSMNKKTQAKVETFSQLDSASQEVRPKWLRITPKAIDGYYFVGMSSKRTEKRDARNESFNDALIGFARFCGLNVQYLAEHRDRSVGGNGGLIDTWTEGNTIAKMQAEMHLGNVTTEDRYTEKYSSFYGGSFMGHTYVDSSLVFVPTEEMELCKEHSIQANTFITKKATEVNSLTAKNESLQSENKLLKKQNTNLTNVALSQVHNSSKFFKQVLNNRVKTPIKEETKEEVVIEKQPTSIKQVNKTVVHTSGLIWSKKVNWRLGIVYNWHDAKQHCDSLSTNNYLDWRLPNINELQELSVAAEVDNWYWSATESNSDMATNLSPDISKTTHAFRIWLGTGDVTSNVKFGKNYVRCVRDSKKIASL